MPELFCPRCDRRLTPDHRCLSRRIFLFAGLGAVFAPAIVKPIERTCTITELYVMSKTGQDYLYQVFLGGAPIRSELVHGSLPVGFDLREPMRYAKTVRLVVEAEMDAIRNQRRGSWAFPFNQPLPTGTRNE